MRRGLAAAATGAVVVLSFAPLFTRPAQAQQGGVTVSSAPITMTPAPGQSGNVFSNNLAVSGHFHVDGGLSPALDWVSVNLSWRGPTPNPPVPGPYTMCGSPPSGGPGAACGSNDFVFSGRPLVPAPTYNGPYRINATGRGTDQFSGQSDQASTPNNIDFNLAVPPPNVTAVTATVNKDHLVTVSWDRDTATPDLRAYFIWRKGPADKDFVAKFQVLPGNNGARVSAPDPESPKLPAGDYVYEVESRRNGGDGNYSTTDFAASDRTQSQSPKLTLGNPPPGATTVPPPKPGPNGAPPVVAGTPSGVNRSSNFSGSSSGSSSATTPTTEAVVPDPGFARGLPFAGSNPPDETGEGDNSAVAVTPGRHSSSGGRGYLVPAAGAAVLVLGALHLRLLKKRLDEPPSNLTPVA